MTTLATSLLASFTTPMHIGTDPISMLWLVPLVVTISIVYKATKVAYIRAWPFVRETAALCGSILVFIAVAAGILYALAWVVTEKLPTILNGSAF